MPAHVNRRMPSSCEPCRRRKIRCYGTQVPCDTCVRRGRASTCRYQRDEAAAPVSASSAETPGSDTPTLMNRITHIEELLQQQIAMNASLRTHLTQTHNAHTSLASPQASLQSNTECLPPTNGRLVRSPSGHIRYVSQASGLDSTGSVSLADIFQSPTPQSNFPFSADMVASRQQLLDLLPPLSQCDQLKDVYLRVFSPLFHVLHEPSFTEAYNKFRSDPASVSLSFLALLFVILGIAIMALADDDPLLEDLGHGSSVKSKIKRIGSKYQSAAMKCLSADEFMWQHNLDTVKALILMIYSFSHTSGPAWPLLGATMHISVAIGCHIDPIHLGNMDVIEAEERRRCWAALTMLYTIQNTCLGNIAPMKITAAVQLPADLEDEELNYPPHSREATGSIPSKMAYILHKFTLYQLASRICELPLPGGDTDYARISTLNRELETEEASQIQRFGHLQNLPTYHQAHYHILSIYTNHLYIVLHRPCLHPTATLSHQDRLESLRQCVHAATRVLSSHDVLCTYESFKPYMWYAQGLGAFHAILASAALMVAANEPTLQDETPTSSILRLLENCLHRFRKLAHRSDICLRGQHLLEKTLSMKSKLPPHYQQTQTESFGVSPDQGSTPGDYEIISPRGSVAGPITDMRLQGQKSAAGLSGFVSGDGGVFVEESMETDGWNSNSNLLNFVSNSPHQHWLSPAAFSWEQWLLGEALSMPPGVDFS